MAVSFGGLPSCSPDQLAGFSIDRIKENAVIGVGVPTGGKKGDAIIDQDAAMHGPN